MIEVDQSWLFVNIDYLSFLVMLSWIRILLLKYGYSNIR
jgi:hypothetical protein